MIHKLALGTVQLGLPYGISKPNGVSFEESTKIISSARRSGIKIIDTAIGYGSSESALGKIGVNAFDVVTKLPGIPKDCCDLTGWVEDQVRDSLGRLNVNKLYALLLHRPQDLFSPGGDELVSKVIEIRESGLVSKIGVSIYDPDELGAICTKLPVELVQAPLNVIDRRMEISGWLDRLKGIGVEIHVRSVFLQGLLLMEREKFPKKFLRWASLWDEWHRRLRESRVTPLEACLAYPLSLEQVDQVIVGVDRARQLQDIAAASTAVDRALNTSFMTSTDTNLINPSNWNNL